MKLLTLGFRLVISIFVGLFFGYFITLFFAFVVPSNEILELFSPYILFASFVGPAVIVFKGMNSNKESSQSSKPDAKVEDIKIDKVDEKPEI